jgi:hypothetical protein
MFILKGQWTRESSMCEQRNAYRISPCNDVNSKR